MVNDCPDGGTNWRGSYGYKSSQFVVSTHHGRVRKDEHTSQIRQLWSLAASAMSNWVPHAVHMSSSSALGDAIAPNSVGWLKDDERRDSWMGTESDVGRWLGRDKMDQIGRRP